MAPLGGRRGRSGSVEGIAKGTARAEDVSNRQTATILEHGRCLMQATQLFSLWQELLAPFADAFTYPGFQRFQEWLTGLALNVEEHTITQSLLGLDRAADWKALESFAEYGHWDQDALERASAQLLD